MGKDGGRRKKRDMNVACALLKEAPQQKSARELEISQHLKKNGE
jgi:hypothetical protein